jgi:hypothetical protein
MGQKLLPCSSFLEPPNVELKKKSQLYKGYYPGDHLLNLKIILSTPKSQQKFDNCQDLGANKYICQILRVGVSEEWYHKDIGAV